MARTRKKAAPPTDIDIAVDGTRYTGSYQVEHDLVRVTLTGGGTKATQLGGHAHIPDALAQLLLGELVPQERRLPS